MAGRRSLKLPITLGVVMIVLVVALTVGWVLLAVFGALRGPGLPAVYWVVLTVGTTFLLFVLVGIVLYLVLSIKAINLNRRQSNFVDSVTHELKSPIASLKLYLQTIRRRRVNEDEHERFCRFMLDDVERLDDLINHLLEAGRLDKPKVDDEEVEEVDLAEMLHQIRHTICLRYRVAEDVVQLDAETCRVRAPRRSLDMIFRNLIDNAIKYAGKPPQVDIQSRLIDGQVLVRIADNGAGIPTHLRRKIFGRFVRLGTELEREQLGTGLGLYIVRTLVKQLRGRVRVQEAGEEKGTVFEVELPAIASGIGAETLEQVAPGTVDRV